MITPCQLDQSIYDSGTSLYRATDKMRGNTTENGGISYLN